MGFKKAALFALALMLPVGATAQQAPASYGAPITLDMARKVYAAAEAEAKKNNWTMVISIIDSGGHLVLFQRMDGTQLGSVQVAQDKAHTALFFKRSSKVFQDQVAQGGDNMRFLSMNGVITVEGGELIMSGNTIVGAIGVSGGTSAQDGQVARVGLAALGK